MDAARWAPGTAYRASGPHARGHADRRTLIPRSVVVTGATLGREEILEILDEVKDPEVPVLSVVELGIVRDVLVEDGVTIVITPTYSGCPAMQTIEEDIVAALGAKDIAPVRVKTVFSPAWTTDWLSVEAKAKLEAYGIAPPGRAASH